MGEGGHQPDDVNARLASDVIAGAPTPTLLANLDRLLLWMGSPETPEARSIDASFRSRTVEPRWARRLALMLLEEVLFSDPRLEPHRRLALDPRATETEVRKRYHLLMRVYHPDLSERAPAWLTERAERINAAYSSIRNPGSITPEVARPGETSLVDRRPRLGPRRRRSRPMHWLRRGLGRPRALRRRVLAGVLVACTTLVIHTCVVNRSWKAWRTPDHVSPVSSRVPGDVSSWERAR